MSDVTEEIIFVVVMTLASFYRAATVNFREYQKEEDAFFPIRRMPNWKILRKLHFDLIVRERTIWECAGIVLNGFIFIATILIKTQLLGHTRFLYSTFFIIWFFLQLSKY